MKIFTNPFRKHDVDGSPDVLITLGEAPRRALAEESSSTCRPEEKELEEGEAKRSDVSGPHTVESLRTEVDRDGAETGYDSIYDRKSKVVNYAIQDIGLGRYNWQLFVLCGFGWFADDFWLQAVALILPQFSKDFHVSDTKVRYTTCALYVGLCLGASFWGVASDIIGRRIAFNTTLLLAGVFGLALGAAPNWVAACALISCMSIGIGGNLPVDGALFLEFLPFSSGNLLVMLSSWWHVGQLLSSLLGWAFLPSFPTDKGWRYFIYTHGAITMFMFVCRFFLFHLFESPKYLLSRGRQAEAVTTVHGLAHKNKRKTWLTEDILDEVGGLTTKPSEAKLSTSEIVRRSAGKFSKERVAPLFANRRLGTTTSLLWFCWATIGLGYPLFNSFLPQYLSQPIRGQAANAAPPSPSIVYRNYAITSIVGLPGSIVAWYTVDVRYIGRKGSMAISTLLSGIFIYLFTVATSANYQLACTCLESFFQNIMYGVLYAYTPEVFPAPNRGTGTGIASFLNRIAGLAAPLIGANVKTADPATPIYVSGALFFAAFVAMCFLPIETRGKQSL